MGTDTARCHVHKLVHGSTIGSGCRCARISGEDHCVQGMGSYQAHGARYCKSPFVGRKAQCKRAASCTERGAWMAVCIAVCIACALCSDQGACPSFWSHGPHTSMIGSDGRQRPTPASPMHAVAWRLGADCYESQPASQRSAATQPRASHARVSQKTLSSVL